MSGDAHYPYVQEAEPVIAEQQPGRIATGVLPVTMGMQDLCPHGVPSEAVTAVALVCWT